MQREILAHLVDNGPMKNKNCTKVLYETLDTSQGSVTDSLRRLEDKGLVRRTIKARRVVELEATPEGQKQHLEKPPNKNVTKAPPKAKASRDGGEATPSMPPKSDKRLGLGTMVRVVGTFITEDERVEYVVESDGTRYLLAEVGHE